MILSSVRSSYIGWRLSAVHDRSDLCGIMERWNVSFPFPPPPPSSSSPPLPLSPSPLPPPYLITAAVFDDAIVYIKVREKRTVTVERTSVR